MSLPGRRNCPCTPHHWDWSWVTFPNPSPGFHLSDVDQLYVVEREGSFLYIETKRLGEGYPSGGQQKLLNALSLVPGFTVLLVHGDGQTPATVQTIDRRHWGAITSTTREAFQARINAWYTRADRWPRELVKLPGRLPPLTR